MILCRKGGPAPPGYEYRGLGKSKNWHVYVPKTGAGPADSPSPRRGGPAANPGLLTPTPKTEFVPFAPPASPTPPPPPRPAAAEPRVLDEVYRGFLEQEPFVSSASQLRSLRGRGLTEEQIKRHGYQTLPTDRQTWTWEPEMARMVRATPGFAACGVRGEKVRFERYTTGPAMLIPVVDDAGLIVGLRVRLDNSDGGGKYRWFVLDDGPAVPWMTHFAFPNGDRARRYRVGYVVEGEIKANILADHLRVPAVSLPGIGSQREVVEAVRRLLAFGIECLVVGADADARRKPQVANDAVRLFRTLRAKLPTLTTGVALWSPEHGNGIDDVIAQGHVWDVQFPETDESFARLYGWHLGRDGRVTRPAGLPAGHPGDGPPPPVQGEMFTADAVGTAAVGTAAAAQNGDDCPSAACPAPAAPAAAPPPAAGPLPLDERPLPWVPCPCCKRLLRYIGPAPYRQGDYLALGVYCGRWRCVCRDRLRVLWARAIRAHVRTHVADGGRLYLGTVPGDPNAYDAVIEWLRTHQVDGRYLGVQPLPSDAFTMLAAVDFDGACEVTADDACAVLFTALEAVRVETADAKRKPVRAGRRWTKGSECRESSGNYEDAGRVGFETLDALEAALQAAGIDVHDAGIAAEAIQRAIRFRFPDWTHEQVAEAIRCIREGRSLVTTDPFSESWQPPADDPFNPTTFCPAAAA
jgi:hypothetical protein